MRARVVLLACVLVGVCLTGTHAASQGAQSPEPSQTVGSKSDTHPGPTDAIVFLVVAMLLGVFTQHVLGFTRIPYTNLLLVKLHTRSCTALPKCELLEQYDDVLVILSKLAAHLFIRVVTGHQAPVEEVCDASGVGSHHWYRKSIFC